MKKIIIIVLALAVLLGILFWMFAPNIFEKSSQNDKNKPVTINILSLWEDENYLKPVLDAYMKANPHVSLNYKFQSSNNYRSRVQAQIDDPDGNIDIFLIHNSWIPMFLKTNQLSVMPKEVMDIKEYSSSFYPIITQSFTKDEKIYAIARGIDGLALYYNEDILKAKGAKPPTNWDEFRTTAKEMTVEENGVIKTSGAALGTTNNVDHWPDIVGLLLLQNPGSNLQNPTNQRSAEVLEFYTSFVLDEDWKTWDKTFDSSTEMFAQNKLAYYFAPSWRAHQLRDKNPQLNFKIVPVPQLPNTNAVAWANFWGYAVSAKSPNQRQAWEFLKFLTNEESQRQLYNIAKDKRLFGLPYSRVSLQQSLSEDPWVSAFVSQGNIYKSWYLSSNTFDKGINDEVIKYFEDAVNATVDGGDPLSLLDTTAKGVEQTLSNYKDFLLLK